MSFRDEVNALIKTPEQIASEKRSASIINGTNLAKRDFEKLKAEIKRKCQNAEYKIVNGKQIVNFDYQYISVYEFVMMTHVWFDGIIHRGMQCIVRDAEALAAYKKELYRLAKEDHISVQLKYVFKDTDGSEQCFDIPGTYSVLDQRTTPHIQNHSQKVIRCSFVL